MSNQLATKCNSCAHQLQNVIRVRLRAKDIPPAESVLLHGDRQLVREPTGFALMGECPRHGLQKRIEWGVAREVERA